MKFLKEHWFPVLVLAVAMMMITHEIISGLQARKEADEAFAAYLASVPVDTLWKGESRAQIPTGTDSGALILYGRELVSNTAHYLGPKGTVTHISNGMNCQNCHLEGGTLPFGNNFGKVYTTYPQYKARNNGMQSIFDRVNDCFERSLNGVALDSNSHEMQAIYAYMKWLGRNMSHGTIRGGTGLIKLAYLDRAASPTNGKQVFLSKCQSCHGTNGEGHTNADNTGYTYPPLWGPHSYNDGSGLYRISNFAGYVKNNMPFGADYHSPQLTDEEAWDVAAFINSEPRPHKDQKNDWKNISKKPVDFPFGPYADNYTAQQHKFGPFAPIKNTTHTK